MKFYPAICEILSRNLKKFRLSQKLTQEQAAEALNVSAQTVSRWECCTTLPEATKLPEIAQLYGVTIDDLFKNDAVAYRNYAQRLAAVYESSRRSEDFICAEREFLRLIDRGDYVPEDMRMLGAIYQFMMLFCAENALHWFDRVLQDDASDPEIRHKTQLQKMRLLIQTGKGDELIAERKDAVADNPHSAENHVLRLRPTWVDAKDTKARCYEKAGDYQKAPPCIGKLPPTSGGMALRLRPQPRFNVPNRCKISTNNPLRQTQNSAASIIGCGAAYIDSAFYFPLCSRCFAARRAISACPSGVSR